jgi:hypothetical protein
MAAVTTIDDLPHELVAVALGFSRPIDRFVARWVSRRWNQAASYCENALDTVEARVRPQDFMREAARHGHGDLVVWARARGCPWDEGAPREALLAGHPGLFADMVARGCPYGVKECIEAAAKGRHETAARWIARNARLPRDEHVLCAVAEAGYLDVLATLIDRGAGCGHGTCWALAVEKEAAQPRHNNSIYCQCRQVVPRAAARAGHIHILEWLASSGCRFDRYIIPLAAQGGHLEVVKWLHARGHPFSEVACWMAAGGGHLAVLRWLRANGCPWDKSTCLHAAHYGHFGLLRWAMAEGCPWSDLATTFAAIGGHLDIAEWTLAQGCALVTEARYEVVYDNDTLSYLIMEDSPLDVAAEHTGRADVLEWMHERGCPCSEWTFVAAARGKKLDVLDWAYKRCLPWADGAIMSLLVEEGCFAGLLYLRERGHPWDEHVCRRAAATGRLDILKWAVAHGCPWNKDEICADAAPYGGLHTLRWLREQGCSWDERVAMSAAGSIDEPDMLAWVVENGCPWVPRACLDEARRYKRRRTVEWILSWMETNGVVPHSETDPDDGDDVTDSTASAWDI